MEYITVGEIVKSDIRTAAVFSKYGIDFCCGGGKIVKDACNKKNVNINELINEINSLVETKNVVNYNEMILTDLIDYIVDTHHSYVLDTIPVILKFSEKVAKVYGNQNPEVLAINVLFNELAIELKQHMKKEEDILFPNIRKVTNNQNNSSKLSFTSFTFQNPIKVMKHEHDSAGDILKKISELSCNYTLPDYACNTFKALYYNLKAFEEDLHIHIHLENNILFPKALNLDCKSES